VTKIVLAHEVDWDGFRQAARRLAMDGVAADQVAWSVGEPADLFVALEAQPPPAPAAGFTLPRALVELAQTVLQARDAERFSLLYALIRRAHGGEREVLEQTTDPLVHRAKRLAQAVRRDTHKFRAFLRFSETAAADGAARHVGWFEPEQFVVEANAGFFARRFGDAAWSILTPYRSAHGTGAARWFGPGVAWSDALDEARLTETLRKAGAMASRAPQKYWQNLPAAAAIPELVRAAQGGMDTMVDPPVLSPPRAPARPHRASAPAASGRLAKAAADAAECRRCTLWERATQTVFGEGPADAKIMFVGEQPGDQEDLAGRPFVGPAGQLFDRAMAEAGLNRQAVYVTNAVKHFKFEPRGKRRIHAKPDTTEIVACKVWLDIERGEVMPQVLVLMGATAARAVLERVVAITRERGKKLPFGNGTAVVTVHPSYLLRLPDEASKAREYAAFVTDLKLVGSLVS
jgi:probable DNA metabolism protein